MCLESLDRKSRYFFLQGEKLETQGHMDNMEGTGTHNF